MIKLVLEEDYFFLMRSNNLKLICKEYWWHWFNSHINIKEVKGTVSLHNPRVIKKINKFRHLVVLKKSYSTINALVFLTCSLLELIVITPLCLTTWLGWLCWKVFEKAMIWSASFRIELGLHSSRCCDCLSAFAKLQTSKYT